MKEAVDIDNFLKKRNVEKLPWSAWRIHITLLRITRGNVKFVYPFHEFFKNLQIISFLSS